LILLILGSSILLFALIAVIVWIFTKQITEPIAKLTKLTNKLKEASDLVAKHAVIEEVKEDEMFKSIKQNSEKKKVEAKKKK
jgi:hypothetical protein